MRFNPTLAALAFATTAAVASFGAQASSVDVKVIGTITPGACTPTLAGGGTVDYGTIGAAELSQDNFTVLPLMSVPFSVSCNAPTKIAIRAVDNRSSSVVPGAVAAAVSSTPDQFGYGLGTSAGKNVGAFMMTPQVNFTADGVAVSKIYALPAGEYWSFGADVLAVPNNGNLTSWANPASATPINFTNLSGSIAIQAVLNKASELPLTNDVPLDGLATLELVYL